MKRGLMINVFAITAMALILGSVVTVVMLWLTLAQALPLIVAGLGILGVTVMLAMFEMGKKKRIQEAEEAPTLIG